jgi:hypothetical protein
MYKVLSGIISRLTSYTDEITGDHKCVFQCNISATEQMFCIHQVVEKIGSIMGQYVTYL